jgi:large subunit ribosomal protein L24
MHIKTGDVVQVMKGRDRGKTGTVLRVDLDRGRVVVEGANLVKRHQRAGAGTTEGGIIEKEAFLSASNVLIYSEELERGVRTTARFVGQDGQYYAEKTEAVATYAEKAPTRLEKVRFCTKTGEVFR